MNARRKSSAVRVGNVTIGGSAPIIVQSMTNTDTADVEGTVAQVKALARAGSELVRVTVNNDQAAAAVPHIRERLDAQGISTPLVGDFHFNGHKLLKAHPSLRPSAGEAQDQSGKRGAGQQARPAVRGNDRDRMQVRQAGAHRSQLGQSRPGSAHAHDGREFRNLPHRCRPSTSCAKPSSSPLSTARGGPRNLD